MYYDLIYYLYVYNNIIQIDLIFKNVYKINDDVFKYIKYQVHVYRFKITNIFV